MLAWQLSDLPDNSGEHKQWWVKQSNDDDDDGTRYSIYIYIQM